MSLTFRFDAPTVKVVRLGHHAMRAGPDTTVDGTNGASLIVFRPILRQFGDGPWLHQARRPFRPTFPRPRLPASWAVADPVVGDGLQQRVDQPPAILRPRRLDLRGERRDGLL